MPPHSCSSSNSALPPSMVIQYGFRDDDDCDDNDRRASLFGGVRQSSTRSLKKIGTVISETKTLLKGASTTLSNMNHLYGYNDDDDDSSSSYESESSSSNDSDDASVSSRASVASKAGQTLKKLGGKLKHLATSAVASDRDHHENQSHKDHDQDDGSVSSRKSSASAAVRRVSSKLGKALKVVGKGKGKSKDKKEKGPLRSSFITNSNHHNNINHDDDDDSSLSDDNDDLLLDSSAVPPPPALQSRHSAGFSLRSSHSGPKDVHPSMSSGPKDVHPGATSGATRAKPRRHFSDPLGACIPTSMLKQRNTKKSSNNNNKLNLQQRHQDKGSVDLVDNDDSDSNLSDLSDNEDDHDDKNIITTTTTKKSVYSNNWSMNVTPELWEQAMATEPLASKSNKVGVVDTNGASNNLFHDKLQHCTTRAI